MPILHRRAAILDQLAPPLLYKRAAIWSTQHISSSSVEHSSTASMSGSASFLFFLPLMALACGQLVEQTCSECRVASLITLRNFNTLMNEYRQQGYPACRDRTPEVTTDGLCKIEYVCSSDVMRHPVDLTEVKCTQLHPSFSSTFCFQRNMTVPVLKQETCNAGGGRVGLREVVRVASIGVACETRSSS